MYKVILGICLALLGADIILKGFTYDRIAPLDGTIIAYPYGGVAVFHDFLGIDFSLNYARNTGAAWGVFANFQGILVAARILVMVCLALYLWRKKISIVRRWALSLVLTGAIGNILDYFIYGYVVDMFYFVLWGYSFPVFNIADSLIFCGMVGLFLHKTLEEKYPVLATPI